MQKLLLGLCLVTSISSFADVYKGTDNNGSPCELHISALESSPNQLLIQVNTLTIQATSYEYKASVASDLIDVSNTFTQGNRDYKITTTDRIIIKLDGVTPLEYSVTRKSKVKTL